MASRDASPGPNRRRLFDVLVVGGGINGAVAAASLAGRGASVALIDRGDFASFTSQESSNLVWGGFKYLENYELLLVFKLCRSRNRLMKAYPDNIKEISLPGRARPSRRPTRRGSRRSGRTAYWGIGQFGTKPPAAAERRADPSRGAGHRHERRCAAASSTATPTSSTTTPASCSRSCARPSRPAPPSRTTSSWSSRRAGRRPLGCRAARRRLRRGAHDHAPGSSSTPPARSSTSSTRLGVPHRPPHRVLQGHPPGRAPAHHRPSTSGCSPSSTTPSGCSTSSRWATARSSAPPTPASTQPFTHVDRRRPRRSCSTRSTSASTCPQPLTADDVIAERSGVRPLVVTAEGGDQQRRRLDLAQPQARDRGATRARQVVTIFGGKLTDCLNVGEEVADGGRVAGRARSRRTCTTGTASRAEGTRDEFYRQARLMRLDELRTRADVEPLTDRLWRRYGRRAFAMLEAIRADPTMGEDVMGATDYLRVELHLAAEHRDGRPGSRTSCAAARRSSWWCRDDDILDSAGPARGRRDPVRRRGRAAIEGIPG